MSGPPEKNSDKMEAGIESTANKTPDGIAAFSALLASDPSLQVYRSFNELASRNLVCMQSELFELEDRLNALDEDDQRVVDSGMPGSAEIRQAMGSWTFALQDERQQDRVKIMRQIRTLLADYRKYIAIIIALYLHCERCCASSLLTVTHRRRTRPPEQGTIARAPKQTCPAWIDRLGPPRVSIYRSRTRTLHTLPQRHGCPPRSSG